MFGQMDYIYEIYKTGSFSKAAANLYISQPALSISVKKLEASLGQQLFERSSFPVQLTEAGRAYIKKVEEIRRIKSELLEYYSELDGYYTGSVSIGAANISMNYVLPDILSSFCEKYPGITLSLQEESLITLKEQLLAETIDFVIDTNLFEPELFDTEVLFTNHMLIAVSDKWKLPDGVAECGMTAQDILAGVHLSEKVRKVSLLVFKNLPFLSQMPENELTQRFKTICAYYNYTPEHKMMFSQQYTTYQFAKKGVGFTLLGDTIICKAPDDGSMRYFVLDCPGEEREIVIASKKKRYLSKAALVCKEFIVKNNKDDF